MLVRPPNQELLWERLLLCLGEGKVVPVVGEELLTLEIDGRHVHLYAYVAERLAARLGIAPGGTSITLSGVVLRFMQAGGDVGDLYAALAQVLPQRGTLPIPTPLLQLAAIRTCNLFISTTFDDLLATAIDRVRFRGEPRTASAYYYVNEPSDLPMPGDGPLVYHLLGRASPMESCALTDAQVLEVVHHLQGPRRPKRLLDQLKRRSLLVIGSSFSGWLARFVLRIMKGQSLFMTNHPATTFFADEHVRADQELIQFLRDFRAGTEVFDCGAVEFVDQLHRRWMDRYPAGGPERAVAVEVPEIEHGTIFVSYASEDRAAAERLHAALVEAGLAVWFDRSPDPPRLRAGEWESRIMRNIEVCSVFVPIISRKTLVFEQRFFRHEWRHAIHVREGLPSGPARDSFIQPILIDDTPHDEDRIPRELRALKWEEAQNGELPSGVIEDMRRRFRDYQLRRRGDR